MIVWGFKSAKAYGNERLAKPGLSRGIKGNILPHEAEYMQNSGAVFVQNTVGVMFSQHYC